MRRTTRLLAGVTLAVGLGLTGCTAEGPTDTTKSQVGEEEVGGPDRVDGGDEDPDGVDKGTGGIDDDDNTG